MWPIVSSTIYPIWARCQVSERQKKVAHISIYISLNVCTDLWQLNASVNALHNLSMDKLGNMCHLSVIDLTRTQMTPCSCQRVTNHLMTIGANTKFVPVCMGKLLCLLQQQLL